MPQIIVAADRGAAFGEGAVTFRERVNVADFESAHFATQLVERLGWAVGDADAVERSREQEPAGDAARADGRREGLPEQEDEQAELEDEQVEHHGEQDESLRADGVEVHAPV